MYHATQDTLEQFLLGHILRKLDDIAAHLSAVFPELSAQKLVCEVDLSHDIDKVQTLAEEEFSSPCPMLCRFFHPDQTF